MIQGCVLGDKGMPLWFHLRLPDDDGGHVRGVHVLFELGRVRSGQGHQGRGGEVGDKMYVSVQSKVYALPEQ